MFSKNCPRCNEIIYFSSKNTLLRSIKRKALCVDCRKGIDCSNINKTCPICNKIQIYNSKYNLLKAVKNNSPCHLCSISKNFNNMIHKYCNKCKKTKTVSNFYRMKKGNYAVYCKDCEKAINKNLTRKTQRKKDGKKYTIKLCQRKWNEIIIPSTKYCSKCGKEKSNSEFYRKKDKIDGLSTDCKKCRYQYYKIHNAKETTRKRNRSTAIKRREISRKLDPTNILNICLLTYRKFNNKCFNCSSEKRLEIDHHKPLSKGNGLSKKNAVLLCKHCNCSKGPKDPKDFYTKIQLKFLRKLGIY